MGSKNQYPAFGSYAWQLIRIKAYELAGRYGFSRSDREDIEQELALVVARRLKHFDPTKASRETFINRIVMHHVATMVRQQRAGKRDYRQCRQSLNDWVKTQDEKWMERGETYDQDDYFLRMGIRARSGEELQDMAIDVRRAVEELEPRLQELCSHLQRSTVTEVARRMRLPRWRLYEMMGEIREVFRRRGLRDYL